ncbi:MAG: hypothetical protein V8S30_01915 [Merdibacter sp.]
MACEEYGFKGRGCIGILTKNDLPAEEIEILSKDVEINSNTSWSERFKSKSSLSILEIEVAYNLFSDYSNSMSKAVLKIPFPLSFRMDIGVNSDLNLNFARDQIIYNEKWLTFEENLY